VVSRCVPGRLLVSFGSAPGGFRGGSGCFPGVFRVGSGCVPGRLWVLSRSAPVQFRVGSGWVPGRLRSNKDLTACIINASKRRKVYSFI
jgi:hypothetical protein